VKARSLALALGAVPVVLWLASASAHAPTISGAAAIGPAPASLEPGATEHDARIHVFVEREGVTLDTALRLDQGPTLEVPLGTKVSSVFVHFDPSAPGTALSGALTFDEEVLGVLRNGVSLDATDGALGRATVTYPKGGARGTDEGADEVQVEGPSTVRFSFREDGDGVDQLRIVTRAEPAGGGCHCAAGGGALWPAALALAGWAAARTRRRRR
jgi:hypothetical protein